MASSSAMTTRVVTSVTWAPVAHEVRVSAIRRSSSSSWVCSSRLIWSSTSARCGAWRRRGAGPRGAPGRPAASRTPGPAGGRRRPPRRGGRAARRSRRAPRAAACRRSPTSARRRSTSDRDIGGSVRARRVLDRICDDAADGQASAHRSPGRRLPCGWPRSPGGRRASVAAVRLRRRRRRRRLRRRPPGRPSIPAYLVHVLGDDAEPRVHRPTRRRRAPTSPRPPVDGRGRRADHPARCRSGILERGDVLLQHDPTSPPPSAPTSRRWPATASSSRPNPDLPAPDRGDGLALQADLRRAWTPTALQEFVDERQGKGPDGVTTDAWGIDDGWFDVDGQWHAAPPGTIEAIRAAMGEPASTRPVWVVRPGARRRRSTAVPPRAWRTATDVEARRPASRRTSRSATTTSRPLDGGPLDDAARRARPLPPPRRPARVGRGRAGAAARSSASWGIGDLADVADARRVDRRPGAAGALALSPLHAPTPVAPIPASPYYPSSRRWRSPLLLRVDEVGTPADTAVRRSPPTPRRAVLADPRRRPRRCWAQQRAALEHLWRDAPATRAARRRPVACRRRATTLERWATFCALAEHHGGELAARGRPSTATRRRGRRAAPPPSSPTGRLPRLAPAARASEQLDAAAVGRACASSTTWPSASTPTAPTPGSWQDLLAPGVQRRRAARRVPARRPGLGPAAVHPVAAARRRLRAARRAAPRRHVARRRPAHRPRHGSVPPLLDPRGRRPRPTAPTCASPATSCSRSWPSRAPGRRLRRRRGPRHRRGRAPRGAAPPADPVHQVVWFEDAPPEHWPARRSAMVTTHDLPTVAGMCHGTDAPPACGPTSSGWSDRWTTQPARRGRRGRPPPPRREPLGARARHARGPARGHERPNLPGHHRRRAAATGRWPSRCPSRTFPSTPARAAHPRCALGGTTD